MEMLIKVFYSIIKDIFNNRVFAKVKTENREN